MGGAWCICLPVAIYVCTYVAMCSCRLGPSTFLGDSIPMETRRGQSTPSLLFMILPWRCMVCLSACSYVCVYICAGPLLCDDVPGPTSLHCEAGRTDIDLNSMSPESYKNGEFIDQCLR